MPDQVETEAVAVEDPLPEELVLTLRKPVTLGTITYSTLTLREPTAAQWAQWDKLSGIEADIKAVATMAGIPEQAVKQIGARDLLTASRFIARFLR